MNDKPIKIGLFGASGKLGRAIALAILRDPAFSLAEALVHPKSSHLGADFGELLGEKSLKLNLAADTVGAIDLWIDASIAAGLQNRIETTLRSNRPLVTGATGLSEADLKLIEKASHSIPVFYTSNFSIGIALMKRLAAETARFFHPHAQVDLIEAHHTRKKDAPSGTALDLASTVQKARPESTPVSIHSIRSGEIVGEHTLLFNSAEEKIAISHAVHSRDVFARGALAAAKFLIRKPPKLYGMEDLFG